MNNLRRPTEEEVSLSRRIAEHVGDAGWYASDKCPNGHVQVNDYDQPSMEVGDECYECGAEMGRGEPLPYAQSMDLLLPVVLQWLQKKYDDRGQVMLRWQDDPEDPFWTAAVYAGPGHSLSSCSYPCTEAAEALAKSFSASVDREQRKDALREVRRLSQELGLYEDS